MYEVESVKVDWKYEKNERKGSMYELYSDNCTTIGEQTNPFMIIRRTFVNISTSPNMIRFLL